MPTGRERVDLRGARTTARHLVEGWAVEAARRRRLAEEYRAHVVVLADELRTLQVAAGLAAHACPTCVKASPGPERGDVPL